MIFGGWETRLRRLFAGELGRSIGPWPPLFLYRTYQHPFDEITLDERVHANDRHCAHHNEGLLEGFRRDLQELQYDPVT